MDEKALRQHLVYLLESRGAHVDWKAALRGLPPRLRGVKPAGAPHTAWELLEHMRLCAWDILEFSRNPKHVSPEWPEGYWPKTEGPPSTKAWERSVRAFESDLAEMRKVLLNRKTDLFAKIPHGTGQTILREALLVADHNAYHVGQLVLLRRLINAWPKTPVKDTL